MVDMHMYVQAKAGLPGRLMDRNSNFYSPKIIWGLCEDLPDSVGLVTVKRKGTIISCLLLLCITVFFFFRIRNTACVVNTSQNGYSKIKTNVKPNTKPKQNHSVQQHETGSVEGSHTEFLILKKIIQVYIIRKT